MPNAPTIFYDLAAVAALDAEQPNRSWVGGMNTAGSSVGIGIATDNLNLEQQLPNWTLLDQDENAREPQNGQIIGGAQGVQAINVVENVGNDGITSLLGEATLKVLADGWDADDGAALGPELITNGTFDANLDDWTNSPDVVWNAGGWAERPAISTGNWSQDAIVGLVQGSLYRVSITFENTVGGLFMMLGRTVITGGTKIPSVKDQVTVVGNVVCGFDNFDMEFRAVDGAWGKIDNVSVKLIL